MPQISVIVPVYKVEKYIHRCVDSILSQTFSDFELILVDDGSPDNCGTICDDYAANDKRVVALHQENGGLSAARNAGIDWAFAHSDSEWLTFIDSDDWVHSEYLSLLLNAVNDCGTYLSSCNLATGSLPDIPEDYAPVKYETEEAYSNDALKFNRINACGKLFHKSLWEEVRFPVGKIHEDRFTTHRLLFQLPEVANVSLPLYQYTMNMDGITHSKWNPRRMDDLEALREQVRYFEKHGYFRARNRTVVSAFYVIMNMIQEIEKDETISRKYAKYVNKLRRELQFYICKYKKTLNIKLSENYFFYEAAYPVEMKLYWYGLAALRKLGIRK